MTKELIRSKLETLAKAARNESFDPLAEAALLDLATMVLANFHAIALSLVQIANPARSAPGGLEAAASGTIAPGLTPRADGSD